ncbi:GNAT family N-acetyltransferase [Sporosarcina aquimarina]|uniref:GNAT family N-acetyltransferase n=1 Tax=Sporosarcina aquimarina TaxID=114975 RepID=A0ABU4FVH8_9BACL|nr:GNAT family N-acetyltransferase [Sporosarcina aquimarina]MDW0108704.1 GNAT family N-acetyltransferase [Sporosarcina aquimarina]
MQIREIEEPDNRAMESIIKKSLESVGLDIPGTAYFDPQLGELAHYYQQQDHAQYWVLLDEQEAVVGGIGIGPYDEENGICELQKLYIAFEAQGKGYSKELMKTALNFAGRHYSACYLETSTKLATANLLYSKFGFRLLDEPLDGSEHGAMDAWYLKDLS